MAVTVEKSKFIEDINNGLKREELRTKYGVTNTTLNMMLKSSGLKIRRLKKDSGFQWAEESPKTPETNTILEVKDKVQEKQDIDF